MVVRGVRSHSLPKLFMAAFSSEIEVELAERRRKTVGIAKRENGVVGIVDFEEVPKHCGRAGDARFKESLLARPHLETAAGIRQHVDADSFRPKCPYHHSVVCGVDAEYVVRAVMPQLQDLLDLQVKADQVRSAHGPFPSSLRVRIGIRTQSGRLCSS